MLRVSTWVATAMRSTRSVESKRATGAHKNDVDHCGRRRSVIVGIAWEHPNCVPAAKPAVVSPAIDAPISLI